EQSLKLAGLIDRYPRITETLGGCLMVRFASAWPVALILVAPLTALAQSATPYAPTSLPPVVDGKSATLPIIHPHAPPAPARPPAPPPIPPRPRPPCRNLGKQWKRSART